MVDFLHCLIAIPVDLRLLATLWWVQVGPHFEMWLGSL